MFKKSLGALAIATLAMTSAMTAGASTAEAGSKFSLHIGIPGYGQVHYGGHGYGWGHYRPRCGWYLRKARRTGSRYWWNKYYRCKSRWYY